MERVAAGCEEIARERNAAARLARNINAEVEAMILGTKDVGERGPKDGPRVVGGDCPGTFDSEDNSLRGHLKN